MLLSVIVPVYNEEDVLNSFLQRTTSVLDALPCDAEILFINDGSTDSSEWITSFTVAPLTLSTYLGLLTATGAFIYGLWIFIKTLIHGDPVAGYPTPCSPPAVLPTLLWGSLRRLDMSSK